jgi:L-arabinose isomerase
MPLQATKLQAEIDLLNAQVLLTNAQIDKINKEIEYLTAKIVTERANTEDIADPASLIGKQISLLTAQRIGFAGDIQTKTAKLHADYDAVLQSVQEDPAQVTLSTPANTAIATAEGYAADIAALP